MKTIRVSALCFVVLFGIAGIALAREVPLKEKPVKSPVTEMTSPRPAAMPTIAINQARPRTIGTNEVQEPDPGGGGGSGWKAGACNCSRICYSGNYTCSLGNGACKSGSSSCTACTNSDCP